MNFDGSWDEYFSTWCMSKNFVAQKINWKVVYIYIYISKGFIFVSFLIEDDIVSFLLMTVNFNVQSNNNYWQQKVSRTSIRRNSYVKIFLLLEPIKANLWFIESRASSPDNSKVWINEFFGMFCFAKYWKIWYFLLYVLRMRLRLQIE